MALSSTPDPDVWRDWRDLVNMTQTDGRSARYEEIVQQHGFPDVQRATRLERLPVQVGVPCGATGIRRE